MLRGAFCTNIHGVILRTRRLLAPLPFLRRAVVLGALVLALSCDRTKQNASVGTSRSTTGSTLVVRRAPIAALPVAPLLPASSLVAEVPREYPPAPLPGCSLTLPVRTVSLPMHGLVVFATATSVSRSLLAVAVPTIVADGGVRVMGDSATWLFETGASEPRWMRGPVDPDAPAAVAGSAGETLFVAWTRPGPDDRTDGLLGLSSFAPGHEVTLSVTVATGPEPVLTDMACDRQRCTVAFAWRDRYALPDQADRASFVTFVTGFPTERFRTRTTVGSAANALPESTDGLVGTVIREHRPVLVGTADISDKTLDPAVLEVARMGETIRAVLARAPTTERCQPGAWRIELATLASDGSLSSVTVIATTDARPRGIRLRAVGRTNEPLVTWLDAPQCSDRFHVLKAWRNGQTVAVAPTDEYDVASAGSRVSLALRQGLRIRWVHATCD